eukprot:Selendium_serpulae@DN5822_c0_g1_i10.p4
MIKDLIAETNFSGHLLSLLASKIPATVVQKIISDAVDVEFNFGRGLIPLKEIGISEAEFRKFIESIADDLLVCAKYKKMFEVKNPFTWAIEDEKETGKNTTAQAAFSHVLQATKMTEANMGTGFSITEDF